MIKENVVRFIKQIEDKKNNLKINVFYYRGWFLDLPVTVGNFYKQDEIIKQFKKDVDDMNIKYTSVNPIYNNSQISFDDLNFDK